jgi:hypothetical protein
MSFIITYLVFGKKKTLEATYDLRSRHKRTIQRNWQHRVHKSKKNEIKNTTQYVSDTTIRKQTQIT